MSAKEARREAARRKIFDMYTHGVPVQSRISADLIAMTAGEGSPGSADGAGERTKGLFRWVLALSR
jgi:hypothetical protein